MPRRRLAWSDVLYTDLSLAAAGFVITNLLTASGTVDLDTLTVTRIIISVDVVSIETNESEYTQLVDFGIGVCSVEAFNIGVTALPDPNMVADYPPRGWLFVDRRAAQQSLPTGGTPTGIYRQNIRFAEDLRAQRKIDRGVLFAIWRNTTVGLSASSLTLNGRIRVLCMT